MQELEGAGLTPRSSPPVDAPDTACAPRQIAGVPWQWLLGFGAVLLGGALYAGWDWLVAAGLATVIVSVGPCLVMCALGLCMRGGKK